MLENLARQLLDARAQRRPCALVTVASTRGSVPREPGSKMLVFQDRTIVGTIGGGKFESLVVDACLEALSSGHVSLKTYPLRENETDSFGAICGGEVTVLIEPQQLPPRLILVGAGHCAQAIARLADDCGFHITALDDRAELLDERNFPSAILRISDQTAPSFLSEQTWSADDSIVLVSRNYHLDRDALRAVASQTNIGYIGMIGSRRKVRRVFDELIADGVPAAHLDRVYAPIGLDIGADAPREIAVSVMAEIIKVRKNASGSHLRIPATDTEVSKKT